MSFIYSQFMVISGTSQITGWCVCVRARVCYLCVHMYVCVCVCDIFCLKLKLLGKLNILKCLSVGHTLRIVTLVLLAGSTMDQIIVLSE